MSAHITKNNSGRLLVAVLAMCMIIAGAAVVFSDESSAANGDKDLNAAINDMGSDTTTLTLEDGVAYTLSGTIDKTGITIQGNGNVINLPDDSTVYFIGTYNFKNVTIVSSWSGIHVAIAMNNGTASVLNFNSVDFQIGQNTVYVDEKNKANFTDCTFTSAGIAFVNTSEKDVTNEITFTGCSRTPDLNVQVTTEGASATVSSVNSSDETTGIVVDDMMAFKNIYVSNNTNLNVKTPLKAETIVAADKEVENVTITTQNPDYVQATTDIPMNTEDGKTIITGTISKSTSVGKDAILENVTVNPGVTLTISESATVSGDMRLYGTIAPANGTATLTVDQDASLTAYSGATVAKGVSVVSIGNGKIDLSAAMSTVTLNDDIESDFTASQSQKVVIADTLTIKSGYKMEILGELIINEGCTVIVENNAQLVLGDGTIVSTGMTVNGTIDVEVGGTVNVMSAKDVTVNGTISSSGTVIINSTVSVKNGGSIIIDDYENGDGVQQSRIEVTSGLTIENGGQMTVAGDMNIADITNKGSVVLNGANITSASTITMAANNAVTDIKSMTQATGASLTITDFGMVLGKNDTGKITVGESQKNNLIFTATGTDEVGIRGLTVTSSVTSEVVGKNTIYHNTFILSGGVSIFDDTDDASYGGDYIISARGNGSVNVTESLTIGKNVKFNLNGGIMNVDGTIDATAVGAMITSAGEINVNGMITTGIDSKITAGINAFHYTDDKFNYYTTLKTSIDNGATDIEYLGNVAVLDTLTIPSGTQVSKAANAGTMTIGSEKNRDVIVTVSDGATVRNCVIEVMATMVFDNNKTGNRNNTVYSDVIIDAEPKRTYTNIYTALSDAADNSTITIARNVFLNDDAEIRQTITLEIPASYGVYLDNGVTLTVNGTILNSGSIGNAVAGQNNEPDTTGMVGFNPYMADGVTTNDNHATIVVNGTIISMSNLDYNTYYISGAYYQMVNDKGSWYYITPVEQAAAVSDDVENGEIEVFGQNTVADVTFTGDKAQPVTVTVTGTLKAGTVTLSMAGIDVNGTFNGTIASAVGSVAVVNATGFAVVDTVAGQDSAQTTYLAREPVAANKDDSSSVTIVTGKINAGQIDTTVENASDFVISAGATLEVSGEYAGAAANINIGTMTVDGTLSAVNGGKIVANTLVVRGTLDVAVEDKENSIKAGSAQVDNLFVGIAQDKNGKFVDSSAAAVNAGAIDKLSYVYISAESTITSALVEKMSASEFYVEGKLWMTIYVANGASVDIAKNNTADGSVEYYPQPGDLTNCIFVNWSDADGEALAAGAKVGTDDTAKVYATLEYNIYTITIFADPGIDAVYIDGKLMTSGTFQTGVDGMWAQGFRMNVAAGEHEITYKLGNYFSGEAKMTVNGESVTGNTFATSGTSTADRNVTIYLQGIEASAPETPSTPSSSDNGMGLTDYLLIILIILIVIMAIMVAMRLMRS